MNLGVGLVDMADNSVDPWQQELNIFSSPKITGIPSPDIVQNTLENLTAGTESRVLVSLLDEELLGLFAARPLNLALGGGPYSLFHSSQPPSIVAEIYFIELPQAEPQGTPNKEIDPLVSQAARIGEVVEQLDGISNGNSTPEDEGTQINSRKQNNQCLNPSRIF